MTGSSDLGLDGLRLALVELSPAQATAAEALASGSTHSDAAEAAGVTRETVTRWAGHHPGFREALARYRQALAAEQAAVVRRLHGKALAAVEDALDDGNVTAALAVLRHVPVPPTMGLGLDAEALVDAAITSVRHSLPPPPPPRDGYGNIDAVAELMDTRGPTEGERAERVAINRLVTASGVFDDEQ